MLTSYTITPKPHIRRRIFSPAHLRSIASPLPELNLQNAMAGPTPTCFEKNALQIVSDETAVDSASELMCIDAVQNSQIVLNLSNRMRTLTICKEKPR